MNAQQIRFEAGSWVERRDAGPMDDCEQVEFETWLAQSMSHRVAYWRADAAWSSAERIKVLDSEKPESRGRKALPGAVKAAAAFVLMATLAAGAALYSRPPADRIYATPIGGHESVSFEDGTRIELNTDTLIRARMTTASRTIWLDHGEAYFQVKHNSERPFVVMVAGHKITDLGTKFLVTADAGKLQVALVQGRARIDTADKWMQQHSALLTPGDVVLATTDSMSRTRAGAKALANALSWRNGFLVFRRTPLVDAAYQINRYNREKLVIADATLNDMPISGTLSATDPDQFARVLENIFGLKAQKKNGEIVISR